MLRRNSHINNVATEPQTGKIVRRRTSGLSAGAAPAAIHIKKI